MRTLPIALLSILVSCPASARSDADWKSCNAEDADTAIPACTRLVEMEKLNPKERSAAFYGRATAYWRRHDYELAIADADKAIGLDPQNSNAYMRRGAVYGAKGDHERALANDTKAIELDPRNYKAYVNRGIHHIVQRDYDPAIADADKAIAINPKFSNAYVVRGNAYQAKGEHDRAIADATKAIELDPSANHYVNRGAIYLSRGDYERAILDYSRTIALNPGLASAYSARSAARLRMGEYDSAIADATKAIEIDPKFSYAYGNRGSAYANQQKYEQAIADYSKALEIDSSFAESRRADAGVGNGDERVVADTTKAIEIDPRLVDVYRIRGTAYERQGELDLAIADYAKYVEMNPNNFATMRSLGLTRFLAGDFTGASSDLARAFELRNDPYALLFRYLARKHIGEPAEGGLEDGALVLRNSLWPYAFTQLYLGKRSPEFFLAAAVKRGDRCMAQFYIGEWYGLSDNLSEATAMLNAATEICDKTSIEYKSRPPARLCCASSGSSKIFRLNPGAHQPHAQFRQCLRGLHPYRDRFGTGSIRRFDQHSHGWTNIGSARAHARLRCEQVRFFFDAIEIALGSAGLLKSDLHVDVQQIGTGLVRPDQFSRHCRRFSPRLSAGRELRGVISSCPARRPSRWQCRHPTSGVAG
jgi:tetratricopeptide (TPR) repeat protein